MALTWGKRGLRVCNAGEGERGVRAESGAVWTESLSATLNNAKMVVKRG